MIFVIEVCCYKRAMVLFARLFLMLCPESMEGVFGLVITQDMLDSIG